MGRTQGEVETARKPFGESWNEFSGAVTKRTKIRGMGRLWRMVIVLAVCFGASLALKIWLDQRLRAVPASVESR